MRFEHLTPTRIVFGAGTLDRAGTEAAPLGVAALVVCGASAVESGSLDALRAALRASGLAVHVHDGVTPDPSVELVDDVAAQARRRGADVLVGLGGGSALDTAKAAAVAVDRESVAELVGATLPDDAPALPVVAIPTTAGSGAEVTKGAIVTDRARGLKAGVRGAPVFPRVAIVDPSLTRSLPRLVAAETAFDAFTHALESYVARRATPLTDVLAEQALAMLAEALPRLSDGAWDDDLRERLALAALLGGLNVANASTCLPHRMQQSMGAVKRVELAHGRGLAALYPAWLERVEPFARERLARVAALLGAADVHQGVRGLLDALALPVGLRAHGYQTADVPAFVASLTGNVDNDPIPDVDVQIARNIFECALLS